MYKQMLAKLKEINIAPVYFIGSGISRRYIKTPDWVGLLEEVRDDWDSSFERYKQKHTKNRVCNCENLATELEEMYFEKLQDNELVEGKEQAYYFRQRICDILSDKISKNMDIIEANEEIQELKKTSPSAIITTNYDNLMQKIFPTYTVYIGQSQLLQKNIDGIGDIYKIHGCISEANSIVITKKDYDNFFENSHYLNAKLLTSFLEYPTIFMGYSLSDRNVISVLDTIVDMLGEEKSIELSSRMWFLRRNPTGTDYEKGERIELKKGRFLDVSVFYVKNFSDFFKVINNHDIKRVPVQFLKYIKANTYKVLSSQEFDPKIIKANLVDLENYDETQQVMNFLSVTSREKEIESTIMNREDLCNSFINKQSSVKLFSSIKFKFNNPVVIPIYWNIKNMEYSKVIEYIEGSTATSYCKKQLLYEIHDKKPLIAKVLHASNIDLTYSDEIDIEGIRKHIKYLYDTFKINLARDQRKLRCEFSLYLINQRLDDLLKCEDYFKVFREEIIAILEYLKKDFIIEEERNILKLLSLVDDNKYSNKFRNALVYIDKCLYKDTLTL